MIKLNQSKFMWKLVNKKQTKCIQTKYYLRNINALNKNKNKNRYIIPYYKTNLGKLPLHYQGICFCNTEVPGQIKDAGNVKLLSKKLKDYMLEKHTREKKCILIFFIFCLPLLL